MQINRSGGINYIQIPYNKHTHLNHVLVVDLDSMQTNRSILLKKFLLCPSPMQTNKLLNKVILYMCSHHI